MVDLTAQQSAVGLLSDMPGLTIDARTSDRGSYVIVECADPTQALRVYELVMMTDSHAELVHSTTSRSEYDAVRQRAAASAVTQTASEVDLQDA